MARPWRILSESKSKIRKNRTKNYISETFIYIFSRHCRRRHGIRFRYFEDIHVQFHAHDTKRRTQGLRLCVRHRRVFDRVPARGMVGSDLCLRLGKVSHTVSRYLLQLMTTISSISLDLSSFLPALDFGSEAASAFSSHAGELSRKSSGNMNFILTALPLF